MHSLIFSRRPGAEKEMRRKNSKADWPSLGSISPRKRTIILAAAAVFLLYLLASLVLGEMGMVKYYRMKAQHEALDRDIQNLKQDNAKLQREVHALRTDPACIERLARDKLGLARPGEIVYYYKSN